MFRFYREKLCNAEKRIYDVLLTCFETQEKQIKIPFLQAEKLRRIFKYVVYDNPLVFYVEGFITKKSFLSNRITIYPKYNYSKKEVELLTKSCLEKVGNILNYGKDLSEYDFEKLVHDLFCKKIRYDNDGKDSFTIIGAFLNKRAVCSGVAKATKLLFDFKSIQSLFIEGFYDNGNKKEKHAWNKVNINGGWYNLDVTQDISLSSNVLIRYDYFNFRDKDSVGYNILNGESFPECNNNCESYYVKNNLILTKESDVVRVIKTACCRNERSCSFVWDKDINLVRRILNYFIDNLEYKLSRYDFLFCEKSRVVSIIFYNDSGALFLN